MVNKKERNVFLGSLIIADILLLLIRTYCVNPNNFLQKASLSEFIEAIIIVNIIMIILFIVSIHITDKYIAH